MGTARESSIYDDWNTNHRMWLKNVSSLVGTTWKNKKKHLLTKLSIPARKRPYSNQQDWCRPFITLPLTPSQSFSAYLGGKILVNNIVWVLKNLTNKFVIQKLVKFTFLNIAFFRGQNRWFDYTTQCISKLRCSIYSSTP